jgi:hypothetical protein
MQLLEVEVFVVEAVETVAVLIMAVLAAVLVVVVGRPQNG